MVKFKETAFKTTELKNRAGTKILLMKYDVLGKPIDRDELQHFLKNKLEKLRQTKGGNDFRVMITATFPDRPRTNRGGFQKIEDFKIPTAEERYEVGDEDWINEISSFEILLYKVKSKKKKKEDEKGGATDFKNDCLYNCLFKAFGGEVKNFKRASRLKSFLNLKRCEKIHIDKLSILEKQFQTEIFVKGDCERIPDHNYTRKIVLNLKNQHYTLSNHRSKQLLKTHVYDDKQPIFYKYENGKAIICDGEIQTIAIQELQFNKKQQQRRPQQDPNLYIYSKAKDMKKEYNEFIKNADLLKKETNDLVNLYQCGGKFNKAIIRIFYNKSRCFEPEEIDYFESKIINDAFTGAIIWGVKNQTFDNAYCYDFNGLYAYILTKLSFPIKKGTWRKLKELPKEFIPYGLYNCKIDISDTRLMKPNKKNIYTHIDLKRARELNYKITLLNKNKFNALLYGKGTRVCGMFTKTIREMYAIRKKAIANNDKNLDKLMKKLMTPLWGGLMEKNKYTKRGKLEDIDILENPIDEFNSTDKGIRFRFYDKENLFKYDYARIGPFITAQGRYMISKEIEPHLDFVKRVHTDGFVVDKKLNIKLSSKLGEIKLENHGKCRIVNGPRKPIFS